MKKGKKNGSLNVTFQTIQFMRIRKENVHFDPPPKRALNFTSIKFQWEMSCKDCPLKFTVQVGQPHFAKKAVWKKRKREKKPFVPVAVMPDKVPSGQC